jgi:dolichol-phosphate mannosyltransferase
MVTRGVQRLEKIGLVIPVYGENETIVSILANFSHLYVDTICLVVDVPVKETMQKLRETAKRGRTTLHIIKNPSRSGVGFCLRQGYEYLMDTGHTICVVMAGNGKDDPAEIGRILAPIIAGEADYVQGSRYLSGGRREGMPFVRQVFNRLYPGIWTILTGKKCTDVTNGFRSFRLEILKDPRINLEQDWLNGYSLEYYLNYKVLALNYKSTEVAVSKIYPFGHKGGYSKIQPLKDWWPIISPLVLLFLGVRK